MQWNSIKNHLKILLAWPLAPFWCPLSFLEPSQMPLGSLWRPWGSICLHLAPLWVHFASIFGAFWLHFGYFLMLGEGIPFIAPLFRFRVRFLAPFWVHFGGQNRDFFNEKSYRFFNRLFNAFVLSFWELFCTQLAWKIASETKKSILWKWASRAGDSSIFKVRGAQNPCKRPPKIY